MKNKLAILALSGVVLVSGSAFGMDLDPKFYVGAEAQINKLKNGKEFVDTNNKSKIRKNTQAAGLILGSRIHENVGVEAGYSLLKRSKSTLVNGSTVSVKMRNPHIDALGYVPVSKDIDVIGSVGLGRLSTKVSQKAQDGTAIALTAQEKRDIKAKYGVRLGVGAQYKIDENLGARFMVRHQKGNKVVKNVNSAALGLFYQF